MFYFSKTNGFEFQFSNTKIVTFMTFLRIWKTIYILSVFNEIANNKLLITINYWNDKSHHTIISSTDSWMLIDLNTQRTNVPKVHTNNVFLHWYQSRISTFDIIYCDETWHAKNMGLVHVHTTWWKLRWSTNIKNCDERFGVRNLHSSTSTKS